MNNINKKRLTKCDFCQYRAGQNGCMVMPSAANCRQATNEFFAFLRQKKQAKLYNKR